MNFRLPGVGWRFHVRLLCLCVIAVNAFIAIQRVEAQSVDSMQGLQQTAIENRRMLSELDGRVTRIERVADALQLESRLTRLESSADESRRDLGEIQSLLKATLGGVAVMAAELIGRLVLVMFGGNKRG